MVLHCFNSWRLGENDRHSKEFLSVLCHAKQILTVSYDSNLLHIHCNSPRAIVTRISSRMALIGSGKGLVSWVSLGTKPLSEPMMTREFTAACRLHEGGYCENGHLDFDPSLIWGLWRQKQVSQSWTSNCIPQTIVGCNYLSLPEIPASGTKALINDAMWLHQNTVS